MDVLSVLRKMQLMLSAGGHSNSISYLATDYFWWFEGMSTNLTSSLESQPLKETTTLKLSRHLKPAQAFESNSIYLANRAFRRGYTTKEFSGLFKKATPARQNRPEIMAQSRWTLQWRRRIGTLELLIPSPGLLMPAPVVCPVKTWTYRGRMEAL